MSFFIKGKQNSAFKRAKFSSAKVRKKLKTHPVNHSKNDEVTSSEDEIEPNNTVPYPSSSEDENETAQEKKLRLAKIYLEEIEKEEKLRLESKDVDQSLLSKRLKEDYLSQIGKLRTAVADKYKGAASDQINVLKCREQRSSITCMCISSDDKFVYCGSKDGVIAKYSLENSKKVGIIPFTKQKAADIVGHSSKIMSMAISTDNKYLVVGDESSDIQVWDPSLLKHVKTLKGHKKAVLGLIFKKGSNTMYSSSKDRTVKVWNLDEMAYVETLCGHQETITSIDTLYRDRVVTSGGRELRIWKITEETQLIFNGHIGNIDNVKLINEENFVSGGDDGQLCVWSVMRKKPLNCVPQAHGYNPLNSAPYWISAVGSLLNTDLIASGSHNGFIKFWKLENCFKSAVPLFDIPLEGFINSIVFTSDGKNIVVACGKEHKLGRWTTIKTARNAIYVIPLIREN